MRKARRWDRTPTKRSVLDTVLDKVLREMFPRSERALGRRHGALRAPAKPRRHDFVLEAIEPRLLMSADISYTSFATDFTLKAVSTTGLELRDNSSTLVGSATLSDGSVNIHRSLAGDLFADTIHLDLDTFSLLNAGSSGITGNGSLLEINYAGADQRLFHDLVTI